MYNTFGIRYNKISDVLNAWTIRTADEEAAFSNWEQNKQTSLLYSQ